MIHQIPKRLILSIFFCLNLAINGAERSVDLTFKLEPGSFHALEGEIRGQPAGGDSDSASMSGTIEATVVFDDETLLAKNITVTGGRIATGEIDISIEGTAFHPDVGNVDGTIRIRLRNLAQTIRTPSPPGTVLPSGQLIPSQHTGTLNEGTYTFKISGPRLESQTLTIDYSDEPVSGAMQGSGRLVITQQNASPLERTLLFRITTANSYEESILIVEGSSARLDLTETIETSSTATVTIPVPPRVILSPASRSIAAGGGNATFNVSSNTNWSWSDNAAWLTSNEATTQDGNQAFSYSVAANTSTRPRSAIITITAGNITRTHTVSQAGAAATLILSPASRSIAAGGGNATFNVSSNTIWRWSDDADWLTSNEATTQDGNQALSYFVAANTSAQPRSATITITAGNITQAHTLTQEGDTDTPIFSLNVSATHLPSGAINFITLSFPTEIGKSYKIEESADLKTWRIREPGIAGNGDRVQRNFPTAGATWFLRVSEE